WQPGVLPLFQWVSSPLLTGDVNCGHLPPQVPPAKATPAPNRPTGLVAGPGLWVQSSPPAGGRIQYRYAAVSLPLYVNRRAGDLAGPVACLEHPRPGEFSRPPPGAGLRHHAAPGPRSARPANPDRGHRRAKPAGDRPLAVAPRDLGCASRTNPGVRPCRDRPGHTPPRAGRPGWRPSVARTVKALQRGGGNRLRLAGAERSTHR